MQEIVSDMKYLLPIAKPTQTSIVRQYVRICGVPQVQYFDGVNVSEPTLMLFSLNNYYVFVDLSVMNRHIL